MVIDKVDNDVQPLDSHLKITTPIPEQLATEIPPAAPERSSYQWYVVIICMVAYILSFVDRQILSLMIEPIKADLMLSDTQFSLLQGLAFSLFYAFMGVPIAALADKKSRVKIISVGIAFWSLATAACGLSKNFIQMFLARLSVGAGEAALSPAFTQSWRICFLNIN